MTVAERNNAATFIQYTTVRPFIFMGFSFKCFFCMDYNYDLSSLLEHTLTHNTDSREVILKKYVTKSKRTLQVDISKLKCRLCGQHFKDLNTIREHLIDKHRKHFYSASNGMTEYKMELINNMFVCHICGKSFHNFKLLNSHMNSHIGKVVCESCGEGFLNQHMLRKHKDSHLAKKFNCQYCHKIFSKRSQLKYHTEIVHKGKERVKLKKCPKCSLTFKEHYIKMTHLKEAHGITKSFLCHVCKTTFSTRRALTEHTNKYHTEKYKCEICSKCFAIESKLKQHMRAHTGERNFICPECKNAYMHKKSLKEHMKSHIVGSKFICTECGATFSSKHQLVKHLRLRHPPYEVITE